MKNIVFVSLDDIALDFLESLLSDFSEISSTALKFPKPEDGDIDSRCCAFIEDDLATTTKVDALFIDISLSGTILDFSGIRLAYHVRLLLDNQFSKAPIILFGETDLSIITQFDPLYPIIFTQGTYLHNLEQKEIRLVFERIQEGKLKGGKSPHDFASQVAVPRPSNHLTHHSTANEWSIVQWAIQLGMTKDAIQALPAYQSIQSELFYKYLSALNPSLGIESNQGSITPISGEGRILLIDDEYPKGWKAIFEKLVQNESNSTISLEVMEFKADNGSVIEFKTQGQEDIIYTCCKKINTGIYDLVIIDLRLCDSDFESTLDDPSTLTGIQIIKKIKELDKGQQIIAFTASNKIWNFSKLKEVGVTNYIHKHSPEIDNTASVIREDIEKAIMQIDLCLEKKLLKVIFPLMVVGKRALESTGLALRFFDASVEEEKRELFSAAGATIEAAFEILLSDNLERNRLSLLLVHKTLEYLADIFFDKDGDWVPLTITFPAVESRSSQADPATNFYVFSAFPHNRPDKGWKSSIRNKAANLIAVFCNKNQGLLSIAELFSDQRKNVIHPRKSEDIPPVTLQELQSYFHLIHEIAKGIQSHP